MQFTPAQAVEAIKARINGVWDNEQLLKAGPLSDTLEDIKRIVEATTDELPNYHLFTVKRLPQTDTKPYRTEITSERYGVSVIIHTDINPIDYLIEKGYNIVAEAEGHLHKNGVKPMYLLSDVFKPFKK